MLQALLIAIITAVILALVVVCVLKVIDSRQKNATSVKKDVREVGAKQVISTEKKVDDIELKNENKDKVATERLSKRTVAFGAVTGGVFALLLGKLA